MPFENRKSKIDILLSSTLSRRRPESTSTDWGETLLLLGLSRATRKTGSDEGRAWIKRWLDYHAATRFNVGYFVGSWGVGLLVPEIAEDYPEHRLWIEETASRLEDVIRKRALRNGEGVLLHNVDLPHIYIDTIFYTAPVLGRIATITGSTDWVDEAFGQLVQHLRVLRHETTPFFIHCEQNLGGHRSEGPWARGNGWISLCCAELLDLLDESSDATAEVRDRVAGILLGLTRHLRDVQSDTGLWPTLLDEPDSYDESSATAMFTVGALALRRHGIGEAGEFDEMIERAFGGLVSSIDDEGRLLACSGGTWPGTREYYRNVEIGEFPWGTGAALLAFTAE